MRARIAALAGGAGGVGRALARAEGRRLATTANEELPGLQTLVGAWPIERDRLEAYLAKALREAKRNTSWLAPDEAHERRRPRRRSRSWRDPDVEAFALGLAEAGRRIALGMTLLKLTVPGVPDLY